MSDRHPWLRRQFLIGLPLIGVFFTFSGKARAAERDEKSTDGSDVVKQLKKLQEELDELRKRADIADASVSTLSEFNPPVGSVLSYLGKWPVKGEQRDNWENETGWLLCDGRSLDKPEYATLKAALGGIDSLPNFDGRVARGKGGDDTEGKQGGRDIVPQGATGPAGGHSHSLPAWTGLMGQFPADLIANGKRYSIRDDNAGWVDNGGGNAHHIEVGAGTHDEGQHRHELGGNTSEQPNHQHTVPAITIVPSYIAVNHVVKFKSNSG